MSRLVMWVLVGASLAGCVTARKPATTVAELSRQLATGRFQTTYDATGKLTECKVIHSTGDADLDQAFCETARACVTGDPIRPGTRGNACMDQKQAEVFARIVAQRNLGHAQK